MRILYLISTDADDIGVVDAGSHESCWVPAHVGQALHGHLAVLLVVRVLVEVHGAGE